MPAGDDVISGDAERDVVLGGNGSDIITGDDERDILLGDHGLLRDVTAPGNAVANGTWDLITTSDPNQGAPDVIEGNAANDIIFGGTAGDVVSGNEANDLIFGDHGKVSSTVPFDGLLGIFAELLPLNMPLAAHPFAWTSIDTQAIQGGGPDLLRGNAGEDVIIGGQDVDRITGGTGDDDLIGGHNVALGSDAGDFIDGGDQHDVIAGDNANLLRTGDISSLRFQVLTDDAIFQQDTGCANIATAGPCATNPNLTHDDPRGVKERDVVLFDHDTSTPAGRYGADVVAGGAEDDVIFGQLGDDWLQGDGSVIDDAGAITVDVRTTRLSVEDLAGPGRDGDDWVEGNGGNDVIFGGLGRDDLIGGSSELYSLTTPDRRPDGLDTIFGGAGIRLVRNNHGDLEVDGHARDSDVILGDNGNIHRLVVVTGPADGDPLATPNTAFLTFNYDTYGGPLRLLPRAYTFLDYTQGSGLGIGAADVVHGENGDDTIHGQLGDDVLFGEGQDDDLYGGWGNDRIFAGTGWDGVMGDDGKFQTSRNGLTEPLHHVDTVNLAEFVSIPGPFTGAEIFILGELHKRADLATWIDGLVNNDVLYGGLGDDFMHGGEGSDAMSGAEAMQEFYNADLRIGALTRLATELPVVDTNPLHYDPATTKFPAYDADDPRSIIPGWLVNFDAYVLDEATGQRIVVNGQFVKSEDGRDRLYGDLWHDWLVGGTDCDWLFGGFGDDLLQLDDNLETAGGANTDPENDDPRFRDGDFAFGGAGRDVLIANTAQDRMFDWGGEFNSYLVPFSPFGIPTVNRVFSPHARDFIRALSVAGGSDEGGVGMIPSGEPFDEEALVEPSDGQLWQDQHGGPRDPQPGNLPGGGRDDVGEPNLHCPCDGEPIIRVVKYVNGEDANATGPVLTVGDLVQWTYDVTNAGMLGGIEIHLTRIIDDAGSPADPDDDFEPIFDGGDTDGDGLIDVGEVWRFHFDGIVEPGRYVNLVTVEGTGTNGQAVSDTDPAVYVASVVELRILKTVNGDDADVNPLVVSVGTPLTFDYTVWTTGTVALTVVAVTDDHGTSSTMADDFAAVPVLVQGFNIGDVDRDGLLDPGELWRYVSPTTLGVVAPNGDYVNVVVVEATDGVRTLFDDNAARVRGTAGIRIEKFVNGVDADDAPGVVAAGRRPGGVDLRGAQRERQPRSPTWSSPTTAGRTRLFTPVFVSGDTNGNGLLDVGEVWRYTSAGVRPYTVVAGPFVNVGTVTAETLAASTVTDDDPAHHIGVGVQLVVEKAVNAVDPANPDVMEDADFPSGPFLVIGTTVTWTYRVFVIGIDGVTGVVLRDDNGTAATTDDFSPIRFAGDTDGDGVLDPGEVWLYRATGTVRAGQYTNVATVTGFGAGEQLVDTDPANHFGIPTPQVQIEKAVNAANPTSPTFADDADRAVDAKLVAAGSAVVWTYLVSNPGTQNLRNIVVVDDNGTPGDSSDDFQARYVSGDRDGDGELDRNEVWLFTSAGVRDFLAPEGLLGNRAVVSARDAQNRTVFDDDPAFLFGAVVRVQVEKAVNGDDADAAPGIRVERRLADRVGLHR